jgi:glycosyltransferase involved in cell wall biosynthesis
LFQLKYKLIFSNGCGFKPATYAHFDYIQHLHKNSLEEALQFGIPESKMTVLPNIMPMPINSMPKEECRRHFGYQPTDWVIVCAAAWNRYHKRIDYLIEEVAKIPNQNVKLLLCGHPEPDTLYLKSLAQRLLPDRVQWHTLPAHDIPIALKAADVFVLPSLNEAFGGVMVEAMMLGIPVISHQKSVTVQFANISNNHYDLSSPGNLSKYIIAIQHSPPRQDKQQQIANAVAQAYSENVLCEKFVNMVMDSLYQR